MSTFNFPTLPELVSRIQNDVKTELPQSNPFLDNSWIRATIVGYAGRFSENYLQLNNVRNSLFITTSTNDLLDEWGATYNITRDPATASVGSISVTGTVDSVIDAGEDLQSDGSVLYTTQDEGTIATQALGASLVLNGSMVTVTTATANDYATGMTVTISGAASAAYNGAFVVNVTGSTTFTYTITSSPPSPDSGTATADVVSIAVQSSTFGEDTNQESGASLTFVNLITGVNSQTLVGIEGLAGGRDEQTDAEYLVPILFKRQNPGANNSVNGITSQLFTINGITRVFVIPGLGKYTVYFVRDGDDNIIPTSGEVTQARALLIADDYLPAHLPEADVIVLAPTPVSVDFIFNSMVPNTASMQDAVQATLQLFFTETATLSTNIDAIAYNSAIFNTVDPTTGDKITTFDLGTPMGNILIDEGELGILGSVVFPGA